MVYVMEKFGLDAQIEPISTAHGKEYGVQTLFGSLIIIPLYHPAVVIYNNKMLGALREDFKKLETYHKGVPNKTKP